MRAWQIGFLLTGLASAFIAPPAAASDDCDASCEEVSFQVSLDGTSPGTYRLAGELCRPRRDRHPTLQLLIHGASYNRHYWDYSYQPGRYSYVRDANAAGFATLAIDRIGHGASDHPPGQLVTVHASANTIHQLVGQLRSGNAIGRDGHRIRFDKIVLVGHSFGSNISWTEAGTYGDVDGVILTGISHLPNPPGAPLTQTYAYPAELDPKFASAGFGPNYLTTLPGKRDELFYHTPGASPAVIAVDEATKDVVPLGLLLDQFTTYGLTQNIHVPVLNVVGDHDILACDLPSCTAAGSLVNEGSNYPEDACYTQIIVPNAGHSTNLHYNAPSWYREANEWVSDRVGRDHDRGRSRPCRHH